MINVAVELNLDYLESYSEEVLEFNKCIEFDLDNISNFMSLEIKNYEIIVLENKGIILKIDFDIESDIDEYKNEIMENQNELFDTVLERKCPDVMDSVNNSIYFNENGNYQSYKVLFLNDDNVDELVEKYKIDSNDLYDENLTRKSKLIIKNE